MSAVVQAAGLLKANTPVDLDRDYLDVLGERDPIGPHRGQFVSGRNPKGAHDGD